MDALEQLTGEGFGAGDVEVPEGVRVAAANENHANMQELMLHRCAEFRADVRIVSSPMALDVSPIVVQPRGHSPTAPLECCASPQELALDVHTYFLREVGRDTKFSPQNANVRVRGPASARTSGSMCGCWSRRHIGLRAQRHAFPLAKHCVGELQRSRLR